MELLAESNLKVGTTRGHRRVWIEGMALNKAGFVSGVRFRIERAGKTVTLIVDAEGTHKVSGRSRGDKSLPIVDLNNEELDTVFKGYERMVAKFHAGKIVITPTRTEARKALRALTALAVGCFVGGGLLSEAAKAAGFPTVAAVEWNPDFADIHESNHPGVTSTTCISEASLEEIAQQVGPVGLYHAGVPCEPFSVIRRNDGNEKADSSLPPEAHELGDMTFWNLRAIDILNPHTVVLEEVPQYLESASWFITRNVLQRLGYTVDARVFNAADFGGLTARKRAVIVGTTFDAVTWPEPRLATRRLRDVLHDPADERCEWFTKASGEKKWLFDHWAKQKAKGNGLISAVIDYDAATVGVIKKRYFAGQGDNPVVLHPEDRDLPVNSTQRRYRWLTVAEVKSLMDLPEAYNLGDTKTTAGEILGQGVHVGMFTDIIRAVTRQGAVQAKAA